MINEEAMKMTDIEVIRTVYGSDVLGDAPTPDGNQAVTVLDDFAATEVMWLFNGEGSVVDVRISEIGA